MLSENEIKEIVKDFFDNMGFYVEVKETGFRAGNIFVRVKAEDPKIIIGKEGQVLREIQHILKLLIRRKTVENFYFDLDINDYKVGKMEYLKDLARDLADDVSLTGREKKLWPMSPEERRMVHMELSKRSDVATQSEGEGEDRKIIIKPLN